MTFGLVPANYSLPELQAVKLTFFAPWVTNQSINQFTSLFSIRQSVSQSSMKSIYPTVTVNPLLHPLFQISAHIFFREECCQYNYQSVFQIMSESAKQKSMVSPLMSSNLLFVMFSPIRFTSVQVGHHGYSSFFSQVSSCDIASNRRLAW